MNLWKAQSMLPSTEEVNRHTVLFVIKFLHEAQHEATAQFLRLPRVVSTLLEKQGSVGSAAHGKFKARDGEHSSAACRNSKARDESLERGAAAIEERGAAFAEGEAAVLGVSPAMSTRSRTLGVGMLDTSRARLATVTPPSSQAEALLLVTPESLGNTVENGMPRGDSGHALEERILGGRLKHRHLCTRGSFQEHSRHSYSTVTFDIG
jgi:hypothetical protein